MFTPLKQIPDYKKVDAKDMNVLVDRLTSLSRITTSGGISIQTSPMGIYLHGPSVKHSYIYLATGQTFEPNIWKLDGDDGSSIWDYGMGSYFSVYYMSTHGVAVDAAGNVYVVSFRFNKRTLRKLDSAGNLIWGYDIGHFPLGSAHDHIMVGIAVSADGSIYVVGHLIFGATANVWKLDIYGEEVWGVSIGDDAYGVAVDVDGYVFVVCRRSTDSGTVTVKKLDKDDGHELQTYDTGGKTSGVAVDADGNVFVASGRIGGISVWKFDNDLNKLDDFDTLENAYGIALDANGNIFVAGYRDAANSKSVWKLDSGLNEVDSFDTGDFTHCVDVDADGDVCVGGRIGSGGKTVWKLDNDLTELWGKAIGGRALGVALDAYGNAFVVGWPVVGAGMGIHKFCIYCGYVWGYETSNVGGKAVTVDTDGNVYAVGENTNSKSVWKLDSDGDLIWEYGAVSTYGVAIDTDRNVYVAGNLAGGKTVWKLDSDGNLVWDYDTTGIQAWNVAVDSDGNVYVVGDRDAVNSKSVWKLNSSGTEIDSFDTGDDTYGITLDADGNIYVVGTNIGNKSVWKLDSGLNEVDSFDTTTIAYSIALAADGNVYVGAVPDVSDDNVWKLDNDLNKLWSYAAAGTDSIAIRAIVVDTNGTVYAGGIETAPDEDRETLWIIDKDGVLSWEYNAGSNVWGLAKD